MNTKFVLVIASLVFTVAVFHIVTSETEMSEETTEMLVRPDETNTASTQEQAADVAHNFEVASPTALTNSASSNVAFPEPVVISNDNDIASNYGMKEGTFISSFLALSIDGEINESVLAEYLARLEEMLDFEKDLFVQLLIEYDSMNGEFREIFSTMLSSLNQSKLENLVLSKLQAEPESDQWHRLLSEFGVTSANGIDTVLQEMSQVSEDKLPAFISSLRPTDSPPYHKGAITAALQTYMDYDDVNTKMAVIGVAARSDSPEDISIVSQSYTSPIESVREFAILETQKYGVGNQEQKNGLMSVLMNESEKSHLRSNAYNAIMDMELTESDQLVVSHYSDLFDDRYE